MIWHKLSQKLPEFGSGKRILIRVPNAAICNKSHLYEVLADAINDAFYENPADMPDHCKMATHWAQHPDDQAESILCVIKEVDFTEREIILGFDALPEQKLQSGLYDLRWIGPKKW